MKSLVENRTSKVEESQVASQVVRRCVIHCGVALVIMSLGLQRTQAETIDRVLAVAAGQIITLSDVTFAREVGLVTPTPAADPVRAILSPLIDRELVLVEVDRYAPPEPAADAIDRELETIRARFAGRDAFDAALARSGVDETHLREAVRNSLRIRAYQDQRFSQSDPRRQTLIDEWLAGLRRRGDVADLYLSGR